MEKLLKAIGWDELYPETLKRMTFFRNGFRECYPLAVLSDDELNKDVVYGFSTYGQGMVYNMYSVVQNSLKEENDERDADSILIEITLKDIFKAFVKAFENTIPDTAKNITPSVYINLFLEYVYSRVIKSKNTL
ncbi:MAG: hypothetical protein WC428_02355 [Candidatus Paceibacterota bacterium]